MKVRFENSESITETGCLPVLDQLFGIGKEQSDVPSQIHTSRFLPVNFAVTITLLHDVANSERTSIIVIFHWARTK